MMGARSSGLHRLPCSGFHFVLADARPREKRAASTCRSDSVIVLEAVMQNWLALEWAADSCKNDREIVLAAVRRDGQALSEAAE
eukprot:1111048-Amphidinium_carterae.1